jgi:hypothetical protein
VMAPVADGATARPGAPVEDAGSSPSVPRAKLAIPPFPIGLDADDATTLW